MKIWIAERVKVNPNDQSPNVRTFGGSLEEIKENMVKAGAGVYEARLGEIKTDKEIIVGLANGIFPPDTNVSHRGTYNVAEGKIRKVRGSGKLSDEAETPE